MRRRQASAGSTRYRRDVAKLGRFLVHPAAAAGGLQPLFECGCERRQVTHVVGGVGELLRRQRAARPVGARMTLGEFHAEQLPHEFRVADLRRKAEQRGGLLGVEHRGERAAGQRQQRLDVLPRCVQQLDPLRIRQWRDQRAAILDRKHIDHAEVARYCGLDQAQPREIGALADELGVERERRLAGPRGHARAQDRRVPDRRFGGRGWRLAGYNRQSPPYYADAASAAQGSMTQLLRSLFQIALLRRDPGVLPASIVLAALLAIAYAVMSALQSWILYGSDRIVMRTAVDLGLSLALVWVATHRHAPGASLPADDQRGARDLGRWLRRSSSCCCC